VVCEFTPTEKTLLTRTLKLKEVNDLSNREKCKKMDKVIAMLSKINLQLEDLNKTFDSWLKVVMDSEERKD